MLSGVMADLVLVAHVTFVAFVVLGGLLALRWPRAAWARYTATRSAPTTPTVFTMQLCMAG